jgi:DNA adenine methylase
MVKNESSLLSSPFKWVGGKSRLRKHIIPLIPEHTCYVEPFGGAAWVLFGKKPSEVEILNDIDDDLITFFRVVRDQPEELIQSFDLALVSRSVFEKLAKVDPASLTDVECAHRCYYLIMAGWGGEFHYPRFSTSITDGGGGNRLVGALRTLRERIEPIHRRLSTVIIENLDWRACLKKYNREGVFLYVDPPYPDNGCNYRHNMRAWDQHAELAETLKASQTLWMCSSYDTEPVRNLFKGFNFTQIESASGMRKSKTDSSRVPNKEILITNFGEQSRQENRDVLIPPNRGSLQFDFE